ncbi:MAG: hypothetical protein H0T42_09660 [Deltaproteobacteria bacterium]|nr:hypothetical protein [Deltaproteobacteria bacterium]
MTRSFGSSRTSARRIAPAPRAPDPRFTRFGFTCFRLVPIDDPDPDERPFTPMELMSTMNAMGAFMMLR